jgi:hypothetical protein
MNTSSRIEELTRWLRTQLDERRLSSIELASSISQRGEVRDDTLILTDREGRMSFGSLPPAQREWVDALLRQRLGADSRMGNAQLFVTCREGETPPRVKWTDDLQRTRDEMEEARLQAHFDTRPYGETLAGDIAGYLDAEGPLTLNMDPRDGIDRALWKQAQGSYAYGERGFEGWGERIYRSFPSREEFLRWLAARSDEDFAKERCPEDPRMWGVNTFSRAWFLQALAQAKKKGR